jgi:hypothetical protein
MSSGGLRAPGVGDVDIKRCFRDADYFNGLKPEVAARALFQAGLASGESGFASGGAKASSAGSGVSMGRMRYATDAKALYRGGQGAFADGLARLHANPATRRQTCLVAACWTKEAHTAYRASQK